MYAKAVSISPAAAALIQHNVSLKWISTLIKRHYTAHRDLMERIEAHCIEKSNK